MATIKSYTDLEQSKKLAEVLPIESADMYYPNRTDVKYQGALPIEFKYGNPLLSQEIAAWSLAALLGVLPEIDDTSLILEKVKAEDGYDGYYYHIEYKDKILIPYSKNPVDACVAMIEKLHELKML